MSTDAVVRYQDRITQPIPQNVAVYEEYYQIFRDTFPLFSRNLQKLTNLGRNA